MRLLRLLVTGCKQYGPGRLPYAYRQDVGAGYAMATATAVATTIFILLTQTVGISSIMSSWYSAYSGSLSEQVVNMSTTVPAGFVAGVIVWRVPPLRTWRGIPAGVAAMLLMYPVSALLDFAVVLPLKQVFFDSTTGLSPLESVLLLGWTPYYMLILGYAALTTTFWLTLPLGAIGGHIYEYAQTESTESR